MTLKRKKAWGEWIGFSAYFTTLVKSTGIFYVYFYFHLLFLLSRIRTDLLRASFVAQLVKNLPAMRKTWIQFLGWEDPLKKGKATHLQYSGLENSMDCISMGLQRVRHDWATFTSLYSGAGGHRRARSLTLGLRFLHEPSFAFYCNETFTNHGRPSILQFSHVWWWRGDDSWYVFGDTALIHAKEAAFLPTIAFVFFRANVNTGEKHTYHVGIIMKVLWSYWSPERVSGIPEFGRLPFENHCSLVSFGDLQQLILSSSIERGARKLREENKGNTGQALTWKS